MSDWIVECKSKFYKSVCPYYFAHGECKESCGFGYNKFVGYGAPMAKADVIKFMLHTMEEDGYITVGEICDLLDIAENTVREYLNDMINSCLAYRYAYKDIPDNKHKDWDRENINNKRVLKAYIITQKGRDYLHG